MVDNGEPPESPGVDEAEFLAAAQGEDGVGMRRVRRLWCRDEQPAGHAEMDEELCGYLGASRPAGKVEGDRLADAVDAIDAGVAEGRGDQIRRRLEGLGLVAGLDTDDRLPVDAGVDAI